MGYRDQGHPDCFSLPDPNPQVYLYMSYLPVSGQIHDVIFVHAIKINEEKLLIVQILFYIVARVIR